MWVLATALNAAAAAETVTIPGPGGLPLAGRYYSPAAAKGAPAIVMLHGCSGMWTAKGEPNPSYVFWAEHFQKLGYATLLLDSFRPRGQKEICTQQDRAVSESKDRPLDAHAALRWLVDRKEIDPKRIHLLGWSNGGSTTLNTLRSDAPGREPSAGFRSAVAFYPGCARLARTPYRPTAPLLILAGGADDWTPARHCEALAREAVAAGAPVQIEVYEGAHHAFDRIGGTVRFRPDVRNMNRPGGKGATIGSHPEARARAIERATAFIEGQR